MNANALCNQYKNLPIQEKNSRDSKQSCKKDSENLSIDINNNSNNNYNEMLEDRINILLENSYVQLESEIKKVAVASFDANQ